MRNLSNRPRRGVTILIGTVLLILLIVAVVGFARYIQSSRVAAGAQGATLGALALETATSAMEEALGVIAESANTKGTPLFTALRAEGPTPLGELVIPVPLLQKHLKADPLLSELKLEGKGVTLELAGLTAAGETSMDRAATFEMAVTVRHVSSGIVRRVRRRQQARVTLLTAPRPFDQFTYLALDAAPLIDPGTNDALKATAIWMREVREKFAPAAAKEARDLLERINERVAADRTQDVEGLVAPFATDKHPAPPTFTESVRDEHHLLPASLALFTTDAAIPNLAAAYQIPEWKKRTAEVEKTRTAYTAARAAYDAALAQVKKVSAVGTDTFDSAQVEPAFEAWKKALTELGRAITALSEAHTAQLTAHHDFTQKWGELAGPALDQLKAFEKVLPVSAFAGRAEHRFSGPTAAADLTTLLARYATTGIQASIHLETDAPIDLAKVLGNRPFKGRLVLSTNGPVTLRDVSVADLASDLLVVCAGGEVTVSGTVRAALIAHAGLVASPGATLSGLLIQPRVLKPEGLAGRVENDGRFHASATGAFHPAFAHVSLAPWAERTSIERE